MIVLIRLTERSERRERKNEPVAVCNINLRVMRRHMTTKLISDCVASDHRQSPNGMKREEVEEVSSRLTSCRLLILLSFCAV